MLVASASCVHENQGLRLAPPLAADAASPSAKAVALAFADLGDTDATAAANLSPEDALAANAALPLTPDGDRRAAPMFARGATSLDQLRSLDCLAQAIYYEARSESEDGQRAVAQVVLNRVRHPAYPSSVCGVVYQGPMRTGGGCQFTFTCDGSLAASPAGPGWIRARELAAEALAGGVYAPVGHATHYHTLAVFPRWAPTLVKSALIGNHIFYRLPGQLGVAGAFSQAYAGHEPMPLPGRMLPRPRPTMQFASLALPARAMPIDVDSFVTEPPDKLPQVRQTERGLPQSRVRDAYRSAGKVRSVTADPALVSDSL